MNGKNFRKQTNWKKNRELGDKMGGRQRLKLKDNIFASEHSFAAPSEFDEVPIYLKDNTSRDWYFPIDVNDIKGVISSYPIDKISFITHIWMRKHLMKKECIGEWICGSGVYLITLYPISIDNKHYFGKEKPSQKEIREYERYASIKEDEDGWYAQFTEESAKKFYLEDVLPSCIEGLAKMV